jgi:WD40 repeat protein
MQSPNGIYAAVGNLDGLVQIVDLKSRQVKYKFENHFMPVRALAFTASGQQLISAGEDLHIFVSDVES